MTAVRKVLLADSFNSSCSEPIALPHTASKAPGVRFVARLRARAVFEHQAIPLIDVSRQRASANL